MANCVNALKRWTGKAKATVIFDSTVDEFTDGCLFQKVRGKPNIAVVGFTTDGDVFGGFYSVAVTKQWKDFFDRTIFAFSFESRGRCMTPQRFTVIGFLKAIARVVFYRTDRNGFVEFGVSDKGGFDLGNERSKAHCWDMSNAFEELKNTTLTGKNNINWRHPLYHHCTRLVAVQLKQLNSLTLA